MAMDPRLREIVIYRNLSYGTIALNVECRLAVLGGSRIGKV